jgi:hypothetical protein
MTWLTAALYVFASVNAIQFYLLSTKPYLDMSRYYAGTERLPFQERVLPVPLLKALDHVAAASTFLRSGSGVFTQALFSSFALSLLSFAVASVFVVLLYRVVSKTRALVNLVAPVFLVLTMATYVVRPTARLFYPYDMPALAFFAAGLYFIFQRQFVLLLLVMLVGTFNRETTLFLLVIYVLDAVSSGNPHDNPEASRQVWMRWKEIPWLRSALLLAVWAGVRWYLRHLYGGNDRAEEHMRLVENLHRFTPQLLPSILNLCGYALPVVYLRRKKLGSARLSAWFLVVPLWIAVMLCVGVITESRIYGELVPLVAVASLLLVEEMLAPPLVTP